MKTKIDKIVEELGKKIDSLSYHPKNMGHNLNKVIGYGQVVNEFDQFKKSLKAEMKNYFSFDEHNEVIDNMNKAVKRNFIPKSRVEERIILYKCANLCNGMECEKCTCDNKNDSPCILIKELHSLLEDKNDNKRSV